MQQLTWRSLTRDMFPLPCPAIVPVITTARSPAPTQLGSRRDRPASALPSSASGPEPQDGCGTPISTTGRPPMATAPAAAAAAPPASARAPSGAERLLRAAVAAGVEVCFANPGE